jgi:O-antigen ligase
MALLKRNFERLPLWIFFGAAYMALRAFFSPSALGAVRFLETAGLALVFFLLAGGFSKRGVFLGRFCLLGLGWGLYAWGASLLGEPFEKWTGFPNPKHLAVFLIGSFFLFLPWPLFGWKKGLAWLLALLTILKLRASGALAGLALGSLFLPKLSKGAKAGLGVLFLLGAVLVRLLQKSSTDRDRLMIWKTSLKVWSLNPFWGNGPGVFDGAFQRWKMPRSGGLSRYLMDAVFSHNEFLELLTAFGLAGVLFLLGLALYGWARTRSSRPPLVGLAGASFFDFCLHTPLVVFQAVGLMASPEASASRTSWSAGFLALGVSLGLFGAAAFVPILQQQAQGEESQNQFPRELRLLDLSERLNAWDASTAWVKDQFLERLYLATGDSEWKKNSDLTFNRIVALEGAEGSWTWERAEILSGRMMKERTPQSLHDAQQSWRDAEKALPYSAYLRLEEASFFLQAGLKGEAERSLQKAVELEPNEAVAWAKLGMLYKEEGRREESRQAFRKSLTIYHDWKDRPIDSPEQKMLDLPEGILQEMGRGL